MARDPHRILLITMGGTIAGQVAANLRDAQIAHTASEFIDFIPETIASLNHEYALEISITEKALQEKDEKFKNSDPDIDPARAMDVNLDSSNIVPRHWTLLAELIRDEFDNYESFVVTHGTNTLGYTCAALTFAIPNSAKPIVLTGSQVPAGWVGSDALTNLENALRVAVWRRRKTSGPAVRGIMAVFGSHIIAGPRVKKSTEFDYDAFTSFKTGSLGRIGRMLHFNDSNLARHAAYITDRNRPEARDQVDLICEARFDPQIVSLTEFPGMSPDVFKDLHKAGAHGIILRAFGAGDPCDNHRASFEYLKSEQIPVVVTTQAPQGVANFQVNEPGKYLREKGLAIPAHDMSIESQTAKLMWLLAKKNFEPLHEGDAKMSYRTLCQEMVADLRGEVDVQRESSA